MIIETDFPDHWKTQLLIKLTGSDAAPMLMIRFWAFCVQRKTWRFANLSNEALAAICRWPGEPALLRRHLLEAGFLDEEQVDAQTTLLIAHDFDRVHSTYVANWKNGALGGRPKTHAEPNGNPIDALGKPLGRYSKDGLDSSDSSVSPHPAGAGKTRKSSKRSKPLASVLPSDQSEPQRGRMLTLNAIFRRPPSDAWSAAEVAALEASGLLAMAELDFVDAAETVRVYFHAQIPREIEKKWWKRTTLQTLLENWGEQADKARAWAREQTDAKEYRKV